MKVSSLQSQVPSSFRDVWVVLDRPDYSLVGEARMLADALGEYVRAAVSGGGATAEEAIACGADYVHSLPPRAQGEQRAAHLLDAFRDAGPEILLLPDSPVMNEAAARLAARLDSGLVTNAFNLRLDESTRQITASRWVYEGDYGLDFTVTAPCQIFTV